LPIRTDDVDTFAEVRGKFRPQLWDPHTGETNAVWAVEYVKKGGQDYTKFALKLKGVTSTFVVGDALP
jgi:hypothetical protein